MEFDMDKAIAECESKAREDEIVVFAIGVGRIAPKLGMIKKQKKAMEFVEKLDGFLGIYPMDLWHTLLFFDTLNNAKGGSNRMRAKGIEIGNIAPIIIKKEYYEKGREHYAKF